ncbi:MAG: CHC2 zinc finger domain-containing protein [Acidobacteriota bacterium]
MPRISEEAIERIKREVNIADLARQRGVQLRGHGENLIGLCPFHDDHEPSLVITPAKNLWNCLGACQKGGDVIRWVEIAERVPFRRAVEILHGGFPLAAQASEPVIAPVAVRCPVSPAMNDREVLASVVGYYRARLNTTDAPEAVRYLERRGIWNEEAIARFSVGFSDRSIGGLLPNPDLKQGKEIRARLAEVGIYRADTGREHFNGCVVFPVIGREGEVLEIYGRKIRDDMRHRVGSHLYLPGPSFGSAQDRHRGIWNGEVLTESKEIILCESVIDALTFWVHGFRNVVPAFGVNGFTEEMFEALRACGTTRVLIAYDRDEAGDVAAAKLAVRLAAASIACYRVLFPRMMDANDYAKKVQPAPQSLGVLLRSAEWMAGPKLGVIDLAPPPSPLTIEPLRITPTPPAEPPHDPEPASSLAAEASPSSSIDVASAGSIDIARGDRHYRIRGLDKNLSYAQMKLVVRVSRGEQVFLDQVDLVSARQRAQFVKQAAVDIGVKEEIVKNDLASIYRELEALQEKLISETLAPKDKRPRLNEEDTAAALELLRAPDLLERVHTDYERCGVVGERTNKLVAYLAAVSRLLDEPLAIIIQSSSAAGKTKLMDAVLDFVPEEERIRYSAMTGQSLFYFEGQELKHKILAVSEEEGAERASYALKLLQSEGQLTIASTGKDPQSGRLVTNEYHVEGPVMIFLTSTSPEIDEELLNRCIVLTVDEDREQTRAIHRLQREGETLEGLIAREEKQTILRLHRNAQRLLRPIRVINPYARALTFVDGRTRTRRDHTKYLTLIRTIALLHQHQRPRKTHEHRGQRIEYIEVEARDIALANELAHEVLGRSLDELAPQSRRLLALLDGQVTRDCAARAIARCDLRFTQREVREWSGWTDVQVKKHLFKLVTMEYVLVHRGGRGQSFVYELLYDGAGVDGRPFLPGLIDAGQLAKWDRQRGEWDHSDDDRHPTETPAVPPKDRPGANGKNGSKPNAAGRLPRARVYTLQKAHLDEGPSSQVARVVEG